MWDQKLILSELAIVKINFQVEITILRFFKLFKGMRDIIDVIDLYRVAFEVRLDREIIQMLFRVFN